MHADWNHSADTRMLSSRISLTFPRSALCGNPRDIDNIALERFHLRHVQTKKSRSNNTQTAHNILHQFAQIHFGHSSKYAPLSCQTTHAPATHRRRVYCFLAYWNGCECKLHVTAIRCLSLRNGSERRCNVRRNQPHTPQSKVDLTRAHCSHLVDVVAGGFSTSDHRRPYHSLLKHFGVDGACHRQSRCLWMQPNAYRHDITTTCSTRICLWQHMTLRLSV